MASAHETGLGSSRRRKRVTGVVLALAVLAAGGWWLKGRLSSTDGAPTYATAPAARADVMSQVTATGTLSPVVTVEVGSQVSGRIKELHADYNSHVKAGQVIATIDPALFQSAVTQARARLASSRAALTKAKAQAVNSQDQYQRTKGLADSGVVAKAELDSALADMRSAQAQVSSAEADVTLARAAVEQAEENLRYTTIASPIDGVVVSRNVDVGQTVAASLSAPTLFVIAEDLRKMEVHTSVAESDVGQLADGMRADFTVDAYPDRTFSGTVKQVRYEATNVSNVVTYDAVVTVENDDLALRPGMTANVTFVIDERKDVLVVPNKALRFRPAGAEARWQKRPAAGEGGAAAAGGESKRPAGDQSAESKRPAGDQSAESKRPAGDQSAESKRPAGDQGAAAKGTAAKRPREARPGHRGMVWVLRDGQPAPVRLRVGLSDGQNTEVIEGDLHEGDAIITGSSAGGDDSMPQQRSGRRRGPPRVL